MCFCCPSEEGALSYCLERVVTKEQFAKSAVMGKDDMEGKDEGDVKVEFEG